MSAKETNEDKQMSPEQRSAANIKLAIILALVAVGIYVFYILAHY